MVSLTLSEYLALEARHGPINSESRKKSDGDQRELQIHDQIIAHCNLHSPRWKFIHANPVVKSTIAKGSQDFTIFLPNRVLCVEVKSSKGKLSPVQLCWAAEMKKIGHVVHVVRSFSEFLALVTAKPDPTPVSSQ